MLRNKTPILSFVKLYVGVFILFYFVSVLTTGDSS